VSKAKSHRPQSVDFSYAAWKVDENPSGALRALSGFEESLG